MRSSFPESGSRDLSTVEETYAFGEELGAALEAGDVVILDGPLGAGKTTLTQGVAKGMQVKVALPRRPSLSPACTALLWVGQTLCMWMPTACSMKAVLILGIR